MFQYCRNQWKKIKVNYIGLAFHTCHAHITAATRTTAGSSPGGLAIVPDIGSVLWLDPH